MASHRPLGLEDVAALLAKSEETRNTILVGGQALNIFAVYYHCEAATSAVSEDIDFFGDRSVAVAAGKAWGGETRLATMDDATPNSAAVIVEIGGASHQIDFMFSLLGIDMDEMQKHARTVQVQNAAFRVMHPLHVLQSQIENIYGPLNRRAKGARTVSRSKLAVRVARAAVLESLEAVNVKEALWSTEKIAEIASSRAGLKALWKDGIELLDAIPAHANWPENFTKLRLPQIRSLLGTARRKYRRQQAK